MLERCQDRQRDCLSESPAELAAQQPAGGGTGSVGTEPGPRFHAPADGCCGILVHDPAPYPGPSRHCGGRTGASVPPMMVMSPDTVPDT